ncbi:hypothetical protein FisN_12Hh100 [Fistulifera solaris]|uniref:Gfo/Idh/MocA-like oxidoreductase N-terminal domain-containing protein n=1 Tax=Fistulifera solaris TaxID=1519565 RepID=A0A1Z5KQE6_FISSO|nr:hypothetical protein FisN_12Hh100 [Fistulifera solaris]|eukprot:GAX28533.1 hypothetical protein FisN_12Hh100 [Fistulifera solaris]
MKDNANPQMASLLTSDVQPFRIGIVVKDRTLPEQSVRAIASPISNGVVTYVVAIDADPEEWRNSHGIPPTAILTRGGYTEMLQSNEIDAVYVVVPTLQQTEFVLPALQASLHVLLDDPISTYIDDFRTQLINAKKYQRFLQFPTMFQNQHRVQTFLDCVLYEEDFGKIESIDVLLSIHMDDVGVLGVQDPPQEGQCVIRRLARSCALLAALMFLRTRKGVRPTAAQVQKVERHPVTGQATSATCRVWFTDDVTLDCRLAYSHTPTRQIMEVRSKNRYATLNDFVIPHPDGLANYRVYDRTPQSGKDFDMMRGEAIDVPGGPSAAVMMWRRFRTLCQSIQEHGWTDCPATHLAREITSVSLQTKLILKALKESELSKEKVSIALDACDVHC